jgi:DNA sulfur modification protein DndE
VARVAQSGGVINQTGDMWWPSMEAMQGENFIRTLAAKRPQSELNLSDYLPARDFLRPDLVSLINCKKVLIDGPTFKNSPKYAFHPDHCENMVIRNVKVNNEWWAQNGDGIDLSACKNALINDCTVTAGDDAICLKSSRSRNQTAPAVQNIVIRNCTVYHGHGGLSSVVIPMAECGMFL